MKINHRFPNIMSYARNLAIFTSVFLLSCLLLKIILPHPDLPHNLYVVSNKLEYFVRSKNDYNTLFIGTSRIHNQILPSLFDQIVKQADYHLKSFNFGVPALRSLPIYFLLQEILATKPANLKWIFVENVLDKGYSPLEEARSNRAIHWQNFTNSLFAIKYILNSHESIPAKIALIYSNLLPGFYKIINIGKLPNEFTLLNESRIKQNYSKDIGPFRDGYVPGNGDYYPIENLKKIHQDFLNQQNIYLSKVEYLKREREKSITLTPNKIELLSAIVKEIEKIGAKPIFLIPPTLNTQADLIQAYKEGYIPSLFAFNDPVKFPFLYQIDKRFDLEHLNERGAEEFTKLLAYEFTQYIHKIEDR